MITAKEAFKVIWESNFEEKEDEDLKNYLLTRLWDAFVDHYDEGPAKYFEDLEGKTPITELLERLEGLNLKGRPKEIYEGILLIFGIDEK